MASGTQTVQTRSGGTAPYVGLRPFGPADSQWFFGRDRDAQILYDRILAGRLTILYALSGLGKSSLLRAKVIPQLQQGGARIVYFDTWSQEDPLRALKDTLEALAVSLGAPEAGRDPSTLTSLLRRVAAVDNGTVVLVLDQFEEFLVRHAQRLDPLRSELAALLNASALDVSVVLTLREEFLAALEHFRQRILNLFQSVYRLEGLAPEDLEKAIRNPPESFDGYCEPELADRLIADLKERDAEPVAGSPLPAVWLPMLQLVCQELWKHAPERRLTLSLYERMGGARRIIEHYVRSLMPERWSAQRLTARLLVHLAPPSGLKISYSVEDLVAITGLGEKSVDDELKRLSAASILRTRDYRAGLRYELEHDAYIPVLRSWRTQVVERDRRRRWLLRTLGTAATLAALVFAGSRWYYAEQNRTHRAVQAATDREKFATQAAELNANEEKASRQALEDWQSAGLLEELSKESEATREALASSRFDVLASYYLVKLEKKGPQRFEDLKRVLQRFQNYLPGTYGLSPDVSAAADTKGDFPLTVEYKASRALDSGSFPVVWRDYGREIARGSAIPVPLVNFAKKDDLAADQIRFRPKAGDPVTLRIQYTDQYMVRFLPGQLPEGPAREFLEHFSADWAPFRSDYPGWRLVPKWSLPIWKFGKEMAGGTIHVPETAISPSGIAAVLALGQLSHTPGLFFSREAVEFLLRNARSLYPATVDEALAARGPCLAGEVAARMKTTEDTLNLPQILDEITESREKCEQLDRDRSAGATQPDAESIAGQSRGESNRLSRAGLQQAQPSQPAPDSGAFYGLEVPVDRYKKIPGITAENARRDLDRLPSRTRHWLESKYSVTDLKRIMRATAAPATTAARTPLRYATWLLTSLCFWNVAENSPQDTNAIAKRLSEMDQARMNPPAGTIPAAIRENIASGVNALMAPDDDPVKARDAFLAAVRENRQQAVTAYLAFWSQQFPETWLRDFRRDFTDLRKPPSGRPDLQEDLRDLARTREKPLDPKLARELAVYRLAMGTVESAEERTLLQDLLLRGGPPENWPPEQARLVAVRFLEKYDPLDPATGDARQFDAARTLIRFSIQSFPNQNDAFEAFRDVVVLSQTTAGPNGANKNRTTPGWAWDLLDQLAQARPGGARMNLQLELAWQLADQERSERHAYALDVLTRFEKVLSSSAVSQDERLEQTELVNYTRARAYQQKIWQGDQRLRGDAERLFRDLCKSKSRSDIAIVACRYQAELLYERGDRDSEAGRLTREGRNDPDMVTIELIAQLARGHAAEAGRLALEAAQKAAKQEPLSNEESAWLYNAALGSALTQSGDWQGLAKSFLKDERQQDAKDYLLMIFYACAGGRKSPLATQILQERWKRIAPETWKTRLRNGDLGAWREFLLGRFMGAPQSAQLFQQIADEQAWRASDLFYLPMSLRGLRCEAWFYDALRHRAEGRLDEMRASLRRSIDLGVVSYYEYSMARFLLR